VSKQDETPPETPNSGAGSWTDAAAIAGAAIGSAAVAAALLFASRRKDRSDKAKTPVLPATPPETD
jgi:Na+/H+-translocating membrane pyrophosphatase